MISVIIPAHNEASVLGRCLSALVGPGSSTDLEVIVVANGCTDATAEVARRFGGGVRVAETPTASKTRALNLGDSLATGFPRVYLDADVVIAADSVRLLCAALNGGRALAAAPRAQLSFPAGSSWLVRRYFAFWTALPYVREGMVTAGVYAVSQAGRQRFAEFPDVICDDTFFRFQFAADERQEVGEAVSHVILPGRVSDLIRIRTRTRLGLIQLKRFHPELLAGEMRPRRYLSSLSALVRRPQHYLGAGLYLLIHVVSALRARKQAVSLSNYAWERDISSRHPGGEELASVGATDVRSPMAWRET